MKLYTLILFLLIFQVESILAQDDDLIVIKDSIVENKAYINALKPSKAAFYSAILPGLGDAYNKRYWKIPVVYAALGASTYYYIYNNNQYHEYRDAFKLHKLGEGDTSQYPTLTLDVLQRAQEYHKKNRDLSLLVGAGIYVLQIVWTSVDAHLEFHNTDSNLSFSPTLFREPIAGKTAFTASITYTF